MRYLKHIFNKIIRKLLVTLEAKQDAILMINGHLSVQNMLANNNIEKLSDTEFKVYSQWEEDGIIAFLVSKLKIENNVFIEFGVENYTESNTRFLLKKFNWSGLVIDGSKENIDYINKDEISTKIKIFLDEEIDIEKIIVDAKKTADSFKTEVMLEKIHKEYIGLLINEN